MIRQCFSVANQHFCQAVEKEGVKEEALGYFLMIPEVCLGE